MTGKARKLVLPFAVPAKDREKALTQEMEKAAVFCLAEMKRKKNSGLLKRKGTCEAMLFIAKFCYPMWMTPWEGRSLLFDGLGIVTHKVRYSELPDAKAFINDINVSAKTREAYSAFLSDRLNFFKDFIGEEERAIEGLVEDAELIQDLATYLKEAKTGIEPMVDRVLLAPNLDEIKISSKIQDLSNHRATLDDEIENLRETMKLLSATTEKHVEAIGERIKEDQKDFDRKVKSLEFSLEEKRSQIREKYDQKITTRTKEVESKLHRLHQKRVKLQKTMQSTNAKIERCEAEIRSCRLNKDETGELRWKEELDTRRKKISVLERDIADLDKEIENAMIAKKKEISEIRSEYDDQIEKAMQGLRDMEAAREAKIQMSEEAIEFLKDSTKTIVDQIDNLIKAKRAALDELGQMGMSERTSEYALFCLPFYLVCYQEKLKNRYTIYPPSFVGSMGILTKFKGALGAAKMKSILQPRSKTIATLLNELVPMIEQNPVFEKEVIDAGIEAKILKTKDSRSEVGKGFDELKAEGWISESELQTMRTCIESVEEPKT